MVSTLVQDDRIERLVSRATLHPGVGLGETRAPVVLEARPFVVGHRTQSGMVERSPMGASGFVGLRRSYRPRV